MAKTYEFNLDEFLGEVFGLGFEIAAEGLARVIHGVHEVTGVNGGGGGAGGGGGHGAH